MTPLEYAEMARQRWQTGDRPKGFGQEGFQAPPWLSRLQNQFPHFLQGGVKKPLPPSVPPGITDTVPAMLTPGEGVLNTGAAAMMGEPAINALNAAGKNVMPPSYPPQPGTGVRGYALGTGYAGGERTGISIEPDILQGNLGTEAGGLRDTSGYFNQMDRYDYPVSASSIQIGGVGGPNFGSIPFAGYSMGPTAYPTSFSYVPGAPGGYAARAMPAGWESGIGQGGPGLGGYNDWAVPGGGTFMGGQLGDYVRNLAGVKSGVSGLAEGGMVRGYEFGGAVAPYTGNKPVWDDVQFTSPNIDLSRLRDAAGKSGIDPKTIQSLIDMAMKYRQQNQTAPYEFSGAAFGGV